MKIVQTVIAGAVAAAVANVALAARSPGVERNTEGFLEAMAKAGAPPLESLSPPMHGRPWRLRKPAPSWRRPTSARRR